MTRLEPYAVKAACTVPRGGGGRKATLLPDYLREEYALDARTEYAAVPDDPTREVPNPVWKALDAQLRQAWARVDRLQSEYGLEALSNLESKHLKVTKRELRVMLAAQSSPHRTRAVAAMCEELNRRKAVFPGSTLRLVYAIQERS